MMRFFLCKKHSFIFAGYFVYGSPFRKIRIVLKVVMTEQKVYRCISCFSGDWLLIKWLVIFCLIFSQSVYAQDLVYQQFTTSDGVASSQVYMTLQDRSGYLWFATDQGISRYDGYEFKTYASTNEIADNTIFTLYEDYKGRIWMSTFSKGLFYIENDSIKEYEFNVVLGERLGRNWVNELHVDKEDVLWAASYGRSELLKIAPDGKLEAVATTITKDGVDFYFTGKQFGDGAYVHSNYALFNKHDPINKHVSFLDFKITKDDDGVYYSTAGFYRKRGRLSEDEWIISLGDGNIYHIQDTTMLMRCKIPDEATVHQIDADQAGHIWVSTNKGVYFYRDGNIQQKPERFCPEMAISSVFQDREGNHWITTLSEGILFVPNFTLRNMLNDRRYIPSKLTTLATNDTELFFGSFNGKLYSLDTNHRLTDYAPCISNGQPLADVIVFGEKEMDVVLSAGSYLTPRRDCKPIADYLDLSGFVFDPGIKFLTKRLNQKQLLAASTSGSYIQTDSTAILTRELNLKVLDRTIYAVLEVTPNVFWLGMKSGVYEFHAKTNDLIFLGTRNELFNRRVNSIMYGPEGAILIGTKGNGGLICYQDTIIQISESEGLNSNIVSSLHTENDSILWVGGPNGLNKVVFDFQNKVLVDIMSFTVEDGLPSNDVGDIEYFNEKICFANHEYLVCFDPSELLINKIPPKINITAVQINHKDTVVLPMYELRYNQNDIVFEFGAISPRSGTQVEYSYRLIGKDSSWLMSRDHKIQFTNLKAGDYRFEVTAKNKDGFQNATAVAIDFSIDKHYSETWWFSMLFFLIIFILVGIILNVLYTRLKQRNSLEKNIIQARFTALLSQMNPHFLFNSLGSIQRYIVENDKKNASVYLSKFSRLVRMVLESSEQGLITVEEELFQLKSYLELEELRFRGKFTYQINATEDIDVLESKIPTMIIQPFIENAIWHGLSHKKDGGRLTLSINPVEEDKGIICKIVDNGIGRVKSREINALGRKDHKSIGLNNVDERIKLINRLYHLKMKVDIEDLYDALENPLGTSVVIYFEPVAD